MSADVGRNGFTPDEEALYARVREVMAEGIESDAVRLDAVTVMACDLLDFMIGVLGGDQGARARRLSIRLVALADARGARKPADAALN